MSRHAATAPGETIGDRVADLLRVATAAAQDESATPAERAEMLMELAMGLQQRPKSEDHLRAAVTLYDKALDLCPSDQTLLRARITARKGTALQAIPEAGTTALEAARAAFEDARPIITQGGAPEELAELEMNLGVVIQNLAGAGRARLTDAIAAYQRALRTFDRRRFPVEFAILQNNLATAFLAIPFTDERGRMREALAVQAFEEGLTVVNLINHPSEYAMLQNNLGNALQYASSSHMVENNLRALAAYDEALKVRTRATAPLEYANTVANKANCLWNLPDDPQPLGNGTRANVKAARALYQEAREIFAAHGDIEKMRIAAEALIALERDMLADGDRREPTIADGSSAVPGSTRGRP
jgi:tetratricopeptide (TPR) repeat protein